MRQDQPVTLYLKLLWRVSAPGSLPRGAGGVGSGTRRYHSHCLGEITAVPGADPFLGKIETKTGLQKVNLQRRTKPVN